MKKILVTGGAGFIGSAVVRHIIQNTQDSVVNVDKLTYAGNLESLTEVANNPRYAFEQVDICDRAELDRVFAQHQPDAVMHLAAEAMSTALSILQVSLSKPISSVHSICLKRPAPTGNKCCLKNAKPSASTIFLPMKSMAICTAQTICLPRPRHTHPPAPTLPPKRPATISSAHGCVLTVCRPS